MNISFNTTLILMVILGLSSCTGPKIIVSNRQSMPFVADGKASEWGDNLLYDSNGQIAYKVSNDDKNLYIMLKVLDEQLIQKVLITGLTVWIDTTDRKKEKFGITFPRGKANGAGMENPQRGNRKDKFNLADELITSRQEIELKLYDDTDPQVMYLNESRIKPAIDADSLHRIVYELALPLGYFIKKANNSYPISIGFEIGNEKSMNDKGSNRRDGEGNVQFGMGGGGPQGGMSGGMESGGGPQGEMSGGMEGGQNRSGGRHGDRENSGSREASGTNEPVKIWFSNYSLSLPGNK